MEENMKKNNDIIKNTEQIAFGTVKKTVFDRHSLLLLVNTAKDLFH